MSAEKVNPFLKDENQTGASHLDKNPFLRDENASVSNTRGFEATISEFKKGTNPIHKEVVRILEKMKSELADKNLEEVGHILWVLSTKASQEELLRYLKELHNIQAKYKKKKKETKEETKESKRKVQEGEKEEPHTEAEKASTETLAQKYYEDFWDNWDDIKKIWNIETDEDYKMLEKIMDLSGGIWFMILDASIDSLQLITVEWVWKIGLRSLYESLKFVIEKDMDLVEYLYEQERSFFLFMLVYVHINVGLVGYRYARDFLASKYGDNINKSKPVKVNQKRITEDGKERTEVVERERFIKRIIGSRYLDAVDTRSNILSLSEGADNLSENQNEYLKRRKTMDILKKYYFDNPKLHKRLQKIETRFLQANSFTYWREIHFLLKEHSLVRRVVGWALKPELPLIGKTELEQDVIKLRESLQKEYFQAVGKLYGINERADGSGIEIDKANESDFLKGLKSKIHSDAHIGPKERSRRIAYLDTYLNEITSGTNIVREETMFEDLMRISDGQMTKSHMLDIIETEINSAKKGSVLTKAGTTIRDTLLRRKAHLKKLQKIVANDKWNGTQEEFNKLLTSVKESKVFSRIPKKSRDFKNMDVFVSEMEATKVEMEQKQKLYKGDSIKWLENYIRYILPNEDEESYAKILSAFKDKQVPYTEEEFYNELNRIKKGFLPSSELLEELEKVKTSLEKEKLTLEKEKLWLVQKIKGLRIVIQESPSTDVPKSEKINILGTLDQMILQVSVGDYTWPLKTLWKLSQRIAWKAKERTLQLIQNIKQIKNLRIKSQWKNKGSIDVVQKKIDKVNDMISQAQEWDLDMKEKDVKGIKTETILSINIQDYNSNKLSKDEVWELKNYLQENKNLSDHDFKATLEKASHPTDIAKSIEKILGQELDLFRVVILGSGENPVWVSNQIQKLSVSIHNNDYTIGQVREIVWEIVNGKEFENIKIADIIKNTSDHITTYSGKADLISQATKIYASLSPESQLRIWEWIKNQNINLDHLPESIANDVKKRANFSENAEKNKVQKAELERMTQELDEVLDTEELKELRREFNEYIKKQGINRNDDVFKEIITAFDVKHKEIKTTLGGAVKPEPKVTPQKSSEPKSSPEKNDLKSEQTKAVNMLKAARIEILLAYEWEELTRLLNDLNEVSKEVNSTREFPKLLAEAGTINRLEKAFALRFNIPEIRGIGTLRAHLAQVGYNALPDTINNFSDLEKAIHSTTDTSTLSSIKEALKDLKITR